MPDDTAAPAPLPSGVSVRCATLADVDTLCAFRTRMFVEMGWGDSERLTEPAVSYDAD